MTPLERAQEALGAYEVRIDLHSVLSLREGTLQGATIYVKNDKRRWTKAKVPMILPSEDGPQTRAAVLRALADIIEANQEGSS